MCLHVFVCMGVGVVEPKPVVYSHIFKRVRGLAMSKLHNRTPTMAPQCVVAGSYGCFVLGKRNCWFGVRLNPTGSVATVHEAQE